jgi:dihydroneopterin aldolase
MYTIHLHNLRFNGFHGLYAAEKLLGNEFEIQLSIQLDASPAQTNEEPSLDYVQAYAIIQECMDQPTPLLEELAMTIARRLLNKFPIASKVHIALFKLHPPIPAFEGKVGVEFDVDRSNS